MKRASGFLLACGAALLGVGASSSEAAVGDLKFRGCLANDSAQGCVDVPNSPMGSRDVVVSPDGRSVYVSGFDPVTPANGIIAEFDRAADGSLTYLGCVADNAAQGCVDLPGAPLRGVYGLEVSNGSLYAASPNASSLSHFTRAPDGSLTFGGCLADTAVDGCALVDGANTPMEFAFESKLSPDGSLLYLRAYNNVSSGGSLVRFSIGAGGAPSYLSCIADFAGNGCTSSGGGRMRGGGGIGVTEGSIYAPGSTFNVVNRYGRPGFVFGQCLSDVAIVGCTALGSETGLINATAVSPDGTSMYIAGDELSAGIVTQFALGAGGKMTLVGCQADSQAGCLDLPNSPLGGATDVAVSPDGASAYVTGTGVATFRAGPDGQLTYASCLANDVTQGCAVVPGGPLAGADHVAVSPDGRNAYVVSLDSKSLSVFERETPATATLDLALDAKGKQRVGKLAVKATCSTACDVDVRAKGRAGKKFKSKLAEGTLEAGVATKLKLKLKRNVLRKVDDRKGKVTFVATATTPAGASADDTAKSKLKP